MTADDTITRARAVVARLRAGVKVIHSPQPIGQRELDDALDDVHNAAPALLRLAEAAGRLAGSYGDDPWWEVETAGLSCIGCGRAARGPHAADCPAMEIDAAMADLAVLAGDAGAGEVGA